MRDNVTSERVMERIVHFFDVDGVLTKPRQRITAERARYLRKLASLENHRVFILSGSTLPMLKEQLTPSVFKAVTGIFTCSGNELWLRVGDKPSSYKNVYKKEFTIPDKDEFYKFLLSKIDGSEYKGPRFDNKIEERPGMVNFSIVGRTAPPPVRERYARFDEQSDERKKIKAEIEEKYGEWVDVAIGGQISIDIFLKGANKFQALQFIKEYYEDIADMTDFDPYFHFYFHGDKLEEGGNDYPVLEGLMKSGWVFNVFEYDTNTLKVRKTYGYLRRPSAVDYKRRPRKSVPKEKRLYGYAKKGYNTRNKKFKE